MLALGGTTCRQTSGLVDAAKDPMCFCEVFTDCKAHLLQDRGLFFHRDEVGNVVEIRRKVCYSKGLQRIDLARDFGGRHRNRQKLAPLGAYLPETTV